MLANLVLFQFHLKNQRLLKICFFVSWVIERFKFIRGRLINFVFIGVEGSHIKPHKSNSGLTFQIDDSLDPTLRELVQRILPLCENYSKVVQFSEYHMQPSGQEGSGRVNQALAGAIYQLLKDYYTFVTQLECKNRKGELTLNKLWFHAQPTMETMLMLREICETIDQMGARGGQTLSLLHQQMINQAAGNKVF